MQRLRLLVHAVFSLGDMKKAIALSVPIRVHVGMDGKITDAFASQTAELVQPSHEHSTKRGAGQPAAVTN